MKGDGEQKALTYSESKDFSYMRQSQCLFCRCVAASIFGANVNMFSCCEIFCRLLRIQKTPFVSWDAVGFLVPPSNCSCSFSVHRWESQPVFFLVRSVALARIFPNSFEIPYPFSVLPSRINSTYAKHVQKFVIAFKSDGQLHNVDCRQLSIFQILNKTIYILLYNYTRVL